MHVRNLSQFSDFFSTSLHILSAVIQEIVHTIKVQKNSSSNSNQCLGLNTS